MTSNLGDEVGVKKIYECQAIASVLHIGIARILHVGIPGPFGDVNLSSCLVAPFREHVMCLHLECIIRTDLVSSRGFPDVSAPDTLLCHAMALPRVVEIATNQKTHARVAPRSSHAELQLETVSSVFTIEAARLSSKVKPQSPKWTNHVSPDSLCCFQMIPFQKWGTTKVIDFRTMERLFSHSTYLHFQSMSSSFCRICGYSHALIIFVNRHTERGNSARSVQHVWTQQWHLVQFSLCRTPHSRVHKSTLIPAHCGVRRRRRPTRVFVLSPLNRPFLIEPHGPPQLQS